MEKTKVHERDYAGETYARSMENRLITLENLAIEVKTYSRYIKYESGLTRWHFKDPFPGNPFIKEISSLNGIARSLGLASQVVWDERHWIAEFKDHEGEFPWRPIHLRAEYVVSGEFIDGYEHLRQACIQKCMDLLREAMKSLKVESPEVEENEPEQAEE